jgi:nucleoside-diphosphate-sugar epimerase
MTTHLVQSHGIYHGLPVFPDSVTGLTAIVTGANGISGQHMVRVLAQSPKRWSKIICLSRRPPMLAGGLPSNCVHIPCDFLKPPTDIATVLKEHNVAKVDYVFFYSYIQVAPKEGQGLWTNAQEMCDVNTSLLSNFLGALDVMDVKPRRILLQTGAKNYGLHLGPASVPQEEGDPRVELEPNFYYPQEDFLKAYCERHSSLGNEMSWNVIRPSFILGAVQDAAMNVCYPLAVYASVCRKLGTVLEYPYALESWENVQDQSSAMLNGYLAEWAVLNEGTGKESFNACDGSAFTWGKFWEKMAKEFDVECGRPSLDDGDYRVVKVPDGPTPRGYLLPFPWISLPSFFGFEKEVLLIVFA